MLDRKNLLIQTFVKMLKHGVERVALLKIAELLDPFNAFDTHILRYFNRIGAPGSDHLFPGSDKLSFDLLPHDQRGIPQQPGQLFKVLLRLVNFAADGINDRVVILIKKDHLRYFWILTYGSF